eukprot:TRINITY_DN71412_c0_g2_i1.p1 TRINITY_DN71412_c0_g2~~TRINITY_DN71412_c0_g2_i1.p1  ORF type:complete len:219 (-),score=60.16 TRINITY_DN71412_c0_g2_i1:61-717(-)
MGNKAGAAEKPDGKADAAAASLEAETQFSKTDIKGLMKKFNKHAKDGKVSKEEFKKIIADAFGGADSALTLQIFNLFDKDGSKEIDFREFVLALNLMTKGNKSEEETLDIVFRCLDLNGDGEISRGELKDVMIMNSRMQKFIDVHKKEVPLDKVTLTTDQRMAVTSEANKIFDALDVDGDKKITRAEFDSGFAKFPEVKKKLIDMIMGRGAAYAEAFK